MNGWVKRQSSNEQAGKQASKPGKHESRSRRMINSPLPGSDGSSLRPGGPSLAGLYRILSCLEPLRGGTTCLEG